MRNITVAYCLLSGYAGFLLGGFLMALVATAKDARMHQR
jgi:hypothetical protein